MATTKVVATALKALFLAWNRPIEPGLVNVWAPALAGMTDEQLESAVSRCIRAGGEHPPSLGQFLGYCQQTDQASLEARAEAAWLLANRNARLELDHRKLGDPLLVHAIGAIGGWNAFCTQPVNDGWQRRDFLAAYISAAANRHVTAIANVAIGRSALPHINDLREAVSEQLKQPIGQRVPPPALPAPEPAGASA
jgi:hypothetical protein